MHAGINTMHAGPNFCQISAGVAERHLTLKPCDSKAMALSEVRCYSCSPSAARTRTHLHDVSTSLSLAGISDDKHDVCFLMLEY